MERNEIQFFDRLADWDVVSRALPHWSQAGTVTFVTWRLADSLPTSALHRIDREIELLLSEEGLHPDCQLHQQLERLAPKRKSAIQFGLFKIRDQLLDQGFGACYFSSNELAEIVLQSLRRFDGERYLLTDAIVMPNHVHFLCSFSTETGLLKQCAEWKRFTARQINHRLGRGGELWQVDQFDHLVRSPKQFEYLRNYIAENPTKAGISITDSHYYQLKL